MSIISYDLLDTFTEIAHFCTTREGGVSVGNFASFNLSPYTGDDPSHLALNQQKLKDLMNIQSLEMVVPFQTHGTEIRAIEPAYFQLSAAEQSAYLHGVDAVFTQMTGVCVAVTTADCVPMLFFDPVQKVVAAVHAGWRGTCGRIAEKMVVALQQHYGCAARDLRVVIGPSISGAVYEVGAEVVAQFKGAGFDTDAIVAVREDRRYLDLWKANYLLLRSLGVRDDGIEISGICTFRDHERFFSARRLGLQSGRLLSGIVLKTRGLRP